MNFHIFVVISTIVFYILLRFYKYTIQKKQRGSAPKSNLIYVLFVPAILYLAQFMYNFQNGKMTQSKDVLDIVPKNTLVGNNMEDFVSDSLLSTPFPESSISITKSSL